MKKPLALVAVAALGLAVAGCTRQAVVDDDGNVTGYRYAFDEQAAGEAVGAAGAVLPPPWNLAVAAGAGLLAFFRPRSTGSSEQGGE